MEHPIQSGSKNPLASGTRGYTLIELIIVMAIVSILMAIAIPQYQKSIRRTKETLLHSNIQVLRTVIDEYTFDKKKAPRRSTTWWRRAIFARYPSIPSSATINGA